MLTGHQVLWFTGIKMRKYTILLLAVILFIAGFLRLWNLGNIPPSPDWDEAALGYNAYSILQTGKDEYGESFPIILRSFGDYKPALYTYLTIPSVAMFGLNTFAVRLPSAIFGILTVLGTYLLVKELLSFVILASERRERVHNDEILPLIAAALLAISPWHIQFSRVAFETNIGVALSVFGALFFLYGLRKNIFLILSALCLSLGFYAYQSEKVFIPLFVFVLIGVFFKQLKKIRRSFLTGAFLVGFLVAFPMMLAIVSDSTTLERAKGVSIFSQQSNEFNDSTRKLLTDNQTNDKIGLLLDNRRVFYAKQIIENYLSHWNLNWLFITGDIGRHHAPGMGLLYLVELPFLFIGIYSLIFGQFPKKMKQLLFLWILIAPIPTSLSTGVPHAVRAFHMVPVITILTAIGIVSMCQFAAKYKVAGIRYKGFYLSNFFYLPLYTLFFILALSNFIYYLNQYFVQQNFAYAKQWQYGYAELVPYIDQKKDSVEKVVISDVSPLDQSYIFFLFYKQFDPAVYQKTKKINNYEFRSINWVKDKEIKNVLFVGTPDDFSSDIKPIKTIYYPDQSAAMEVVRR